MKTYSQRINNITGQLNGISKMIDSNEDYPAVITQIKAVKSALDSVIRKYTEEKLTECLGLSCEKSKKCDSFLKEIISTI